MPANAILCMLFSTLVTASSAIASQNRGQSVLQPPEKAFEKSDFDPAASRGLFVGISDFSVEGIAEAPSESFSPIPYAVDDAIDLAYLFSLHLKLIEPQGVTLCLSGEPKKERTRAYLEQLKKAGSALKPPQRNSIFTALSQLSQETRPEGVLVVSFATHGFSIRGSDYLVTSDSTVSSVAVTGLEVAHIIDEVSEANARRRVVFLDACREKLRLESGRRAGGVDPDSAMGQAFSRAISDASGMVVMAAARLGGYAYDDDERKNGVFTASILEGLSGQASADGRGFLTPANLGGYVNSRVCEWARLNRRVPDERCGITFEVEGPAADMPLAVDPSTFKPPAEYARLVDGVLQKIRQNLGEEFSGEAYDRVKQAFPDYYPAGQDQRKLLDDLFAEAERLDGEPRSQKIFALYLDDWLSNWGAAAIPVKNPPRAPENRTRRAETSPPMGIEALRDFGITVSIPNPKSRSYCGKLSGAGLRVDCRENKNTSPGNKLILKCPDLPEDAFQILEGFLEIKISQTDLRRQNAGNKIICNRFGGMELTIGG